jgi:hypothetical protein
VKTWYQSLLSNSNLYRYTWLDPDYHFKLTGLYILDSEWTNFGDTVYSIIYGGVSDIDGATVGRGMAVIHADQAQGTWEWSKDGGLYWTLFGYDLAPERPLLLHAGKDGTFHVILQSKHIQ